MTQQSVAEESGLSVKQVSDLLRGQANPTYLNMLRLADGLRVSSGTLMTRVDELRAKHPRG
jgi:transcriptional regulator with XRE-family HTH domain